MKMVFPAYTKGTTTLLAAILGLAEKEGVRNILESVGTGIYGTNPSPHYR